MRWPDAARTALLAAAACSMLCAATHRPPPTPDPATFAAPTAADKLFEAARTARSRSSYARYAVYATVLRFRAGGHTVKSTWDTIEDVQRRVVHSHSQRREDEANPHVPHGINFGIGVGPGGPNAAPERGEVLNGERDDDPIGQLTFAVDQDFGLALDAPSISASRDMADVATARVPLLRIGRTGTIVRTYEVTDLGDVVENGVPLHHLGLRPLRDPKRFRLREIWTDAKSSVAVRAIVAGVGNHDPLDGVRWRVEFAQVDGGTYVARETALDPVESGAGRLDDVTISFEELRPANALKPYELIGLSEDVGTTDP